MKLAQRRYFGGQCANGSGRMSTLMVKIDAEAAQPVDAVRRVCDLLLFILLQAMSTESGHHRVFNLPALKQSAFEGCDLSFAPDAGGHAGNQQQITAATLHQHREPMV